MQKLGQKCWERKFKCFQEVKSKIRKVLKHTWAAKSVGEKGDWNVENAKSIEKKV